MFEIAGALAGLAGFALAMYLIGNAHGQAQGRQYANDEEYDKGWDRGYDSGWEQCRNKAIEYGVAAL